VEEWCEKMKPNVETNQEVPALDGSARSVLTGATEDLANGSDTAGTTPAAAHATVGDDEWPEDLLVTEDAEEDVDFSEEVAPAASTCSLWVCCQKA